MVRFALRQPYTVAVACGVLLLMAVLAGQRMAVDIFPLIDIPVVAVVWTYPGMMPRDMESRVVLLSERNLSSTVDGISRIESQSETGVGLVKIFFQPGTNIGNAIAQIVSSSQTAIKAMPPGITPPYVVQSNASNVPVAQLTLTSETMPEQNIADYGQNFIRLRLFTIPGLATPQPYGGKTREITIDVDPAALNSKGLAATDVLAALQQSNIILPAGTARIGTREYDVAMNSSPSSIEAFNQIPIKVVNGAVVSVGDVARVRNGFAEQTNIVRVDGRRAAYLTILKKADASTLAVVEATKQMIPEIRSVAPAGFNLRLDFDQSRFVRAAISGVMHEAITSAVLVALMILAFLGSWRSVLIACISIPLAMATSVIGLNATGNSFNIMTLGGLSLSIGLLVDNAIVTIENVHRNRAMGKPLTVAILDALQQIATPAIVATLAVCVVFFPVVLLEGPARFLFIPIALAVVIAMLASYVLSRTLVPTLSRMMLGAEPVHDPEGVDTGDGVAHPPPLAAEAGPLARFGHAFNNTRDHYFARFQNAYARVLTVLILHRRFTLGVFGAILVASLGLFGVTGQDFFPSTDAGIMKLHYRAPSGTRIEQTEALVSQIERRIRQLVPAAELATINSTIGIPGSLNLAFVPTNNASGMDAEILVALKPGHRPTEGYVRELRTTLNREFPGSTVYFQTADIVGQVLNFGLPAPIDVQIQYPDLDRAYAMARTLRDRMREVPGAADVTIKQVLDYPTLFLEVDRQRAAELGITQRDAASSMLISLASSGLVSPSYFVNPANQVNYLVAVEVPLPKMTSTADVLATPVTAAGRLTQSVPAWAATNPQPRAPVQTLDNIAHMTTTAQPAEIDHYTVARVLDITANVEGRDLGSVVDGVQRTVSALGTLPAGMHVTVRGQGTVMHQAFSSLGLGFVVAVVLVFALMAVLFQSWIDPLIIMGTVPGAVVGILWMLVATGTTINIESLLGAIMAVGIAVANSILVVSFANDQRVEHSLEAAQAAIEAGKTRLRPVLMTAGAMILGMLPMAIGSGEGGEQNAPLGRAVIGGLGMATVVTLLIVPVLYTVLARKLPGAYRVEQRFQAESQGLAYHEPF